MSNVDKRKPNNIYKLEDINIEYLYNEDSVPEMRIWSILLLIKSDLKWCIHLSRSLFSYLNRHEFSKNC